VNCTGTLSLHDQTDVVLYCSLTEGHEGWHYDDLFSYLWPIEASIGTCHLSPIGGTEVVQ
jgi:hypothetical protein